MLAVALALRCLKLTQSFWLDELFTLQLSGAPRGGFIQELLHRHLRHLPLYYLFMRLLMPISDAEWFMRLPSLICSMAKLPLFWILAQRLVNRRAAFVAVVLLALSPIDIYLAQEARLYAVLQLVDLAALYFVLRVIEEDRFKYWAAFTIFTALSIHLAYFGIIASAARGFFLLGLWAAKMYRERPGWKPAARPLVRLAISAVVCVLLFTPCFFLLRTWMTWETDGGTHVVTNGYPALKLLRAVVVKFGWGIDWALVLSLLALFVGTAVAAFRRPTLLWLAVTHAFFGIVPVYLVLQKSVVPIFMPKYVVFMLVPYLLLLGLGLVALFDSIVSGFVRLRPSWEPSRKTASVVLAVAVCIICFMPAIRGVALDVKENWRDTCNFIVKHKEPGDAVITTREYIPESLPYYGSELPPVIALEQYPDSVAALRQAAKEHKRLWFMSWSAEDDVTRAMDAMGFVTIYDFYAQRFILKLWDSAAAKSDLAPMALAWRLKARDEVRYHPWMDVLVARAYAMNKDAASATRWYDIACAQLRRYAHADPWIREEDSQYVGNNYMLASALNDVGHYADAAAVYRWVLSRMPGAYGVAYHLAEAEIGAGNPDAALDAFHLCRRADPKKMDLWLLARIAQLYERRANRDGAANVLKLLDEPEAQKIPREPKDHVLAAKMLGHFGQTDRAIAEIRAIGDISPADADTSALLAELLINKKDLVEAGKILKGALEAHPDHAHLLELSAALNGTDPK